MIVDVAVARVHVYCLMSVASLCVLLPNDQISSRQPVLLETRGPFVTVLSTSVHHSFAGLLGSPIASARQLGHVSGL
jgi:hypothetical protein